jgi:aldehyde:ferredoxin oxidoreductase
LRVDLTHSVVSVEEFDEAFYRIYPGGKALAAYLLLREIEPGIDPLGPDNVLVLINGLITGAPISTATRFTAAARSPLSNGFGESEAGGFWGPELKLAGWEGMIVTGRAAHPVYISVKDDKVEIQDARRLWGREPEEAQAMIREEMNDRLARVLQIGIGGENLVRYGALINDLRHFNGRNGMGAVMGSKNLKAIGVRGTGKYSDYAHNPQRVAEIGRLIAKRVKEHPQSWDLQEKGTPGLVSGLNAGGILPTRNFREGAFEGVDRLAWEAYEKELLSARRSCYACAIRCKREVRVNDRYQVSDAYGGPEYETIGSFGANCGIDDLQAIAKANELCGRYTLDSISTGEVVAFAMECFEHGLITPEQTGGAEWRFGNASAMLQIVDWIAHRQGIGDLLANGVKRAAEAIGGDARYFAMHVKGQELPMHEPRGKVGVGLAYAVNEAGADHLVSFHDPMFANAGSVPFKGMAALGLTEAMPPRELSPRKVAAYALGENWSSFGKTIGFCYFGPAPRSLISVEEVVEAVRAASGWDFDKDELLRIGERATNLARVFNAREGFSRKDDMLPDRLFQPLESGALQGVGLSRAEFDAAMTELYRIKGWNPETARPTRERLEALDIGWAADLIE